VTALPHLGWMIRTAVSLAALALLPTGALAQDAAANALRDVARAQERQARSLERIERIERDRARDEDRARRNAARDARSTCCRP
jgi:hypothetical protein